MILFAAGRFDSSCQNCHLEIRHKNLHPKRYPQGWGNDLEGWLHWVKGCKYWSEANERFVAGLLMKHHVHFWSTIGVHRMG